MYYGDKREAKVNIMAELVNRGWEVYGYTADDSDSMTDYYAPAHWDGIATKNGYVLIIDNNSTQYSGYELKSYNYNKSAYTANDRITKLTAMMNDAASTENEKTSCAVLIEKEEEKAGVKPTYTVKETYPRFNFGNPKSCSFHIEKDGQIITKGTGVFSCYVGNDHYEPNKSERISKVNAFVDRVEGAIKQDSALESEVIKVPKTVIKPVEIDTKVLTANQVNDNTYFIMKVGYTGGNSKGTMYKCDRNATIENSDSFIFRKVGRNLKPSKAQGNSWYQSVTDLNNKLAKGHIAIVEMKEFTEYEEKTVYKKTAKKQQPNFDVPAITGDVQEVAEEVKTDSTSSTVNEEAQASSRQLWALHCATKIDTRGIKISKKKASELITKSKSGHNIIDEVKAFLNSEEAPDAQSEEHKDVYTASDIESMTESIIEYTASLMIDSDGMTAKRPDTAEAKEEFKTKLHEYMFKQNYPIDVITAHIRVNYATFKYLLEALESLSASQNTNNNSIKMEQDQNTLVPKIDKQIESNQKKLDALSGDHLTNTWKRQQEESSRENKREQLRFDIALLEYIKDKSLHNSMTILEQALIIGSVREDLKNYRNQKYKYKNEISFPQIDNRYDSDSWYNKVVPSKQKRLAKANITNTTELIASIDEYNSIVEELETPENPIKQKIKKLESEVKFKKIDGYFPTPNKIIQRMLDIADVRDGERILEPSAGHGSHTGCYNSRDPKGRHNSTR
jgi:hypothetical protein